VAIIVEIADSAISSNAEVDGNIVLLDNDRYTSRRP
jgi:hypothetical protein